MNIDQLKHELESLAAEVTADEPRRQEAVDARIGRQRRQTAAGGVAAAATVVALAVLVPSVLDTSSSTPPPASNSPERPERAEQRGGTLVETTLPTVSDNGATFYSRPAGADILGHVVGQPAAREVTLQITPTTLDLTWAADCWDPAVTSPARAPARAANYQLFVNDQPLSETPCSGDSFGPLGPSSSFEGGPARNANAWRQFGLRVGEPVTFTMRVKASSADRGVAPQPLFAVWEQAPRTQIDGVWHDDEVVVAGHTYRRTKVATSHVEDDQIQVDLDTSGMAEDLVATFGMEGPQQGAARSTLEGNQGLLATASNANGQSVVRNDGQISLRIRVKAPESAVGFLAVYERVD